MLSYLFPGQGTQREGMYDLFCGEEDAVKEVFEAASDGCGRDIVRLMKEGGAEELTKTVNAQPVVTAVNCALWKLLEKAGLTPDCVAGHSLGQYAALMCGGVFSLYDGFRIVEKRAALMENVRKKGGLTAVLADEERVKNILADGDEVWIALLNAPKQTVVGGELPSLRAAEERLEAEGILYQRLNVANAFHTPLMRETEEEFCAFLDGIEVKNPTATVFLNVKGDRAVDGKEAVEDCKKQSCHAVRWKDCMIKMTEEDGIFAEVGVGTTLAGLLKKHKRTAEIYGAATEDGRRKLVRAVKGDRI